MNWPRWRKGLKANRKSTRSELVRVWRRSAFIIFTAQERFLVLITERNGMEVRCYGVRSLSPAGICTSLHNWHRGCVCEEIDRIQLRRREVQERNNGERRFLSHIIMNCSKCARILVRSRTRPMCTITVAFKTSMVF